MNTEINNESDSQDLAAHWRRQIDHWQNSGLSQGQFCKDNDLTYHQFLYWRHKLNKPKSDQPITSAHSRGFTTVTVQPMTEPGLSLSLPNGIVMRGICADNIPVVRQLLDQL
jgi:hypothetical protein